MKRFSIILLTSLFCLVTISRALAHGDLHEQIQEVSKLLKNDPRNAMLYHKRGELHRAHAEYPEALKDYAEAEKITPSLDVIFLSRGRALYEFTKFNEALGPLNTFLSRQPGHVSARWVRGQVYARLNQREDAEEDFRQAIESGSETSPDQFIERSQNLGQAGYNEKALIVIKEGIKRLGPLITLEMEALELELSLKDHGAAHQRIDVLLENAERKETYLVRKAEIFDQMNDKRQSQEWYTKALKAIAELPERQRNLKATSALENKIRIRLTDKEQKAPAQ